MKTIGIMQPYILPYLGYYQLINLVDEFIILDDVNFIKKGWINRNQILNPNGTPLLFTVPLKDVSQNRYICEVSIHNSYDIWKKKFQTSLKHNYKKAPNFRIAMEIVDTVLNSCSAGEPISKLAINSLKEVTKYLEIKTEIIDSSSIYNNRHLKGADRILDICLQEKAERYVNLIGGQNLYSKETFEKAGIELKFHKIGNYSYKQGAKQEFQPYLSIIDILMFCSPMEIQELLKQCEII